MAESTITRRQQYWLDHIKAADASDGTLVEYAKAQGMKVKVLYQWKTVLARRGLLAAKKSVPAFVAVQSSKRLANCRIVLLNGTQVHFEGELAAATIREILTSVSRLA